MIQNLIRPEILKIPEINWGDIPENGIRLLWGENPLVSVVAIEAVKKEADKLNLYPSPVKEELNKRLAKYNSVEADNIVLTNGSDDGIELIAKVFISGKDNVIIPIPTFPVYETVSLMMGANITKILLDKDFTINPDKISAKVNNKTKVIWLANPNNPTGNILLSKKQIEKLAKRFNCLLVIDECYFELAYNTAAPLFKKYPNVITLRSFSKVFGLAGVRLGYIIADKKTVTYLNRARNANQVFSVNRFAQAAANAMLEEPQLIKDLIKKYLNLKRGFEIKLNQINNLEVIETKTTFCLAKIRSLKTAGQLKNQLKKKNIFIKDCSIYEGLGKQYIYLGVPEEKSQTEVINNIKYFLE